MFKLLRRLLVDPIYVAPTSECRNAPPDYLTLREIFDMPPYHPFSRRQPETGKCTKKPE